MDKRWTGKGLWRTGISFAGVALLAAGLLGSAFSAPQSNIRDTAHNLSRTGKPNSLSNVRAPAGGETAVCAFCHTPHGASTSVKGPLWNRSASVATYNRYTSLSMDGNNMFEGFTNQPAGSSLLCLSCHDGMVALGNVNVLKGAASQTINLQNTDGGKMPAGPQGALSGFTRHIGTDLTNDHPVSITYNDALAAQDGEMTRMTSNQPEARDTIGGHILGIRSSGFKPLLPLEPTGIGGIGQVQCGTCHDPHLSSEKFLRLNRFQVVAPTGANFNENTDQICLACHPKLGRAWAESAHANPTVADEAYTTDAAARRNFPTGTTVWQAACLNCHDTHTVQGARRLLREGAQTMLGGTGTGSFRIGSAITPADSVSSIENTCYQCHDSTTVGTRVIGTATGTVPEIRVEFERYVRMPISTAEQLRNKREVHDIVDSDFMESAELLGKNNPENRHVECTDCHNPHRVRRATKFFGTSADTGAGAQRTHVAGGTKDAVTRGSDGNVASGVLRGTWGVEPVFGATSSTWPQLPNDYVVKKGDPGLDTSIDKNKTYLTREYQLCFKCHSNYSNSNDFNAFPPLGNTLGGTTGSGAQRNYLTRYTNVAAEFGSVRATDPPTSGTDQGESGNDPLFTPNGSSPSAGDPNHRSWHPVMWPTGRTSRERVNNTNTNLVNVSTGGGAFGNIRAPFNTVAYIGYQTMHCSDCHGHSQSWTQGTGPNLAVTQGPHGSDKKYLLKGDWNIGERGNTPSSPGFCGNCHQPTGTQAAGGFRNGEASHSFSDKAGAACNFCHIAVPHGWKNKAFLVNLNCVGTEAGLAPGCNPITAGSYTVPPYYVSARLKVTTWRASTAWSEFDCLGGKDGMRPVCEAP